MKAKRDPRGGGQTNELKAHNREREEDERMDDVRYWNYSVGCVHSRNEAMRRGRAPRSYGGKVLKAEGGATARDACRN